MLLTNHPQRDTACHQAIKSRTLQSVWWAMQQDVASDARLVVLTMLLYGCIAAVFSDRHPEAVALSQCLQHEMTSLPALISVLKPLAVRQPLALDDVFDSLIRLTPVDCLHQLGPLCYAITGGEGFIRPLLESLGLRTISDVALILAVLDGCLAALTETDYLNEATVWKTY